MKKLIMIVAGVFVAGSLFVVGVSAQDSSIENTGADSNNVIEHNNSSNTEINCDTDVDINSNTDQSSGSGDATVSGNTTGGSATSGDAGNSSSTNVDVDVECMGEGEGAVGVTPTPSEPGEGGQVIAVTDEGVGAVPVLPDTAGTSPASVALFGALTAGGLALATRAALFIKG